MLEILKLWAGYPGKDVLKNITFTAPAGKVTAIVGPNGSGKSTLLKALCGILPVKSGEILLDGQAMLRLPAADWAKKASYLAQNRQIPQITARRMVLHGRFPYLRYPRRYRQADHHAADAAMAQMGITELADTPLEHLSGGQRQKVYIAMALAQNAQVVLLDEPTTFLDVAHQMLLLQHARQLADSGKTVVMVLHDLSLALRTADQLVVLSDSVVETAGSAEEVYLSGCLDRVFGVHIARIRDDSGWHYYCR